MEDTTIRVKKEVKKELDQEKIIKQEPYNSVIKRLITEKRIDDMISLEEVKEYLNREENIDKKNAFLDLYIKFSDMEDLDTNLGRLGLSGIKAQKFESLMKYLHNIKKEVASENGFLSSKIGE